jgi:thioredoxin reductase (NADPH)
VSGQSTVLVIGAGAAGVSAAIHAAWRGARVVLLDPLGPGGQLVNAGVIETIPGHSPVQGPDLVNELADPVGDLGIEFEFGSAVRLRPAGTGFSVDLDSGGELDADAVIVATGSRPRELGVPGESEFTHKGVSHCATCDGPIYREQPVVVVGGGDAAADAAQVLAGFCSQVTVVHRGGELKAAYALVERLNTTANIDRLADSEVREVLGDNAVSSVVISTGTPSSLRTIVANAVFVTIGVIAESGPFEGALKIDLDGRVEVDASLATSLPGVFAAGSVRGGSSDQVAAAIGDGVAAAAAAVRWLTDRDLPTATTTE